jgi:cytochrome c6
MAFGMTLASAAVAPAQAADLANGARMFNARCAGCHGADGRSVNPAAPNLIGGVKTMQPDTTLMLRIKTGKGQCPPFLGILKDKDILDVIAHLRTLR